MSTQDTALTEADHFGKSTEDPASVNGHDITIGDQLVIHGLTNGLADQIEPIGNDENQPEPNDSRPKGNKSTFKITSVTYNKNQEDDTRRSLCEEDEDSASVEESMKAEIQADGYNPTMEKKNTDKIDPAKRFKVVKYQKLSEPYFVHRWKVTDYREPEPANRFTEISTNRGSESTSSSRASSVNFVHGVDDPSKNPLIAQNPLPTIAQSNDSTTLKQEILTTADDSSTIRPTQSNQTSIHDQVTRNTEPSPETAVPVILQSNETPDPQSVLVPSQSVPANQPVEDSDASLTRRPEELVISPPEVASSRAEGESTDENAVGASDVKDLQEAIVVIVDTPGNADQERPEDDAAASGVAIDNKIEQAMDLVKSHLMLAVKEEVDELKLQIKQLLEKNAQLEQENKLLRDSASPEVLAQIKALSRQTASSTNT